jgi:hypothetical protein
MLAKGEGGAGGCDDEGAVGELVHPSWANKID